jgi:hypothetical protein
MAAEGESSGPNELGFGKRASFLFTLDNALGVSSDRANDGPAATYLGAFPGIFGPRIGLHGASAAGITGGANVGLTYRSAGGDGIVLLSVAPRIGYATSVSPTVGFWLRGGPQFHFIGGSGGGSSTSMVGVGGEAFVVLTPVDHFGLMIGPTAEATLSGTRDDKYTSIGLAVGLVSDL